MTLEGSVHVALLVYPHSSRVEKLLGPLDLSVEKLVWIFLFLESLIEITELLTPLTALLLLREFRGCVGRTPLLRLVEHTNSVRLDLLLILFVGRRLLGWRFVA